MAAIDFSVQDAVNTVRDVVDFVSAGADAGANIAGYLHDIISPESRRSQANPIYGGNSAMYPGMGGQMMGQVPQQRPVVPYGYAEPGSGYGQYQTGMMTEEGISDPNYGKGGMYR